jgi:hypothetical protein
MHAGTLAGGIADSQTEAKLLTELSRSGRHCAEPLSPRTQSLLGALEAGRPVPGTPSIDRRNAGIVARMAISLVAKGLHSQQFSPTESIGASRALAPFNPYDTAASPIADTRVSTVQCPFLPESPNAMGGRKRSSANDRLPHFWSLKTGEET